MPGELESCRLSNDKGIWSTAEKFRSTGVSSHGVVPTHIHGLNQCLMPVPDSRLEGRVQQTRTQFTGLYCIHARRRDAAHVRWERLRRIAPASRTQVEQHGDAIAYLFDQRLRAQCFGRRFITPAWRLEEGYEMFAVTYIRLQLCCQSLDQGRCAIAVRI